ncbi:hypothetical protein LMG28614_01863 [Paraburkholderia ultramafica]|uniref:Uncharacterized protein n=1 Tax=Paraburkholderia ultramafica TaxID=1544867 RepID=A0A6S7BCC1_9BURK|nr:hypothetical protein LMG28614_01863 [Paraburkholderia ultramafica]
MPSGQIVVTEPAPGVSFKSSVWNTGGLNDALDLNYE